MTVNKVALAEEIAARVGVTKKEAEDMIAAFVDTTIETLTRGDRVTIAGFGQFTSKTRAGRIGVNPQNPTEKIPIPPVTVAKFKAGLALKTALKESGKAAQDTPVTPSEANSWQ